MINYKANIPESQDHHLLGFIGLPVREKTTSSSTTTSSTTFSITSFLPLPPFPLPLPLPLLFLLPRPRLPRCCYYNKASSSGVSSLSSGGEGVSSLSDRGAGEWSLSGCGGTRNISGGSGVSGRSRPGVRGIAAFFLTELLPFFLSSKREGYR